jgi:colicin import membrane protein
MGRALRVAACLVGLGLVFAAAAQGDARAERTRIRAEIAAAENAFDAQARDCRARFIVTACVDEARRTRDERVQALRREQSLLDETQRRRRAAQRQAQIRAKVEAAAERERRADAAAPVASAPGTRVVTRAPTRRAQAAPAATPAASDARQAERDAQAARRVQERRALQDALRKEREATARRAQQRAEQNKPVAPLPLPGAASVPR